MSHRWIALAISILAILFCFAAVAIIFAGTAWYVQFALAAVAAIALHQAWEWIYRLPPGTKS